MALKKIKGKISKASNNGPIVGLRKKYEINSQQPLPDYDSGTSHAFDAVHIKNTSNAVFAYVCNSKIPPRLNVIKSLYQISHRCLMRAIDWDVVFWPPKNQRCLVIICQRPANGKIFKNKNNDLQPMKEDAIINSFLIPTMQALRELHKLKICHGNIHIDNLYINDMGKNEFILGECYTTPTFMNLPMAYNTFVNSLSLPAGRGTGRSSDDMYSVGICLLSLIIGKDATKLYKNDKSIQQNKLKYGSYGTLAQHYRISNSLMEPLRGLLNDDPNERWGIEDIFLWINGKRLSPKQQIMPPKASQPFQFSGKEYGTARELAYAMAENWDESLEIIQNGTIDNWLRRSLQDERITETVNKAKDMAAFTTLEEKDKLISRVLMAMSLDRPIQLRNLSASISGLSQLIGIMQKDIDIRLLFSQILTSGLLAFYIELKPNPDINDINIFKQIDKVKTILSQKDYGGGTERVAYLLNPWLPCMSPIFDRDYVPNIDYLLPALNRYARLKGDDINIIIDKDIVAYILVHSKQRIKDEISEINSNGQAHLKILAEVKILAKLQESLGNKRPMVDLCNAVAVILKPAIESFNSTQIRERITKQIETAVTTGRILEVFLAVNIDENTKSDNYGFELACSEYKNATEELIKLNNDIENKNNLATELAGQLSSSLSGLCAIIFAFSYAIYNVF